jgi:hypothetical protein
MPNHLVPLSTVTDHTGRESLFPKVAPAHCPRNLEPCSRLGSTGLSQGKSSHAWHDGQGPFSNLTMQNLSDLASCEMIGEFEGGLQHICKVPSRHSRSVPGISNVDDTYHSKGELRNHRCCSGTHNPDPDEMHGTWTPLHHTLLAEKIYEPDRKM